jgi:hypothetical protein
MWIDFIKSTTVECGFFSPASIDQILLVEKQFNLILPSEFKDIISETNGVEGAYGLGLIWSLDRIVEENQRFRNLDAFKVLYMPFDSLFFFADSGTGDQFAFPILGGVTCKDDVFVWGHEDDSRKWVAPSVSKYLEWWLEGIIKI